MPRRRVTINRAPVLTLWAAVVAQRLGFAWDEALTLGRAVAGLNAQSKGRRLGIFRPAEGKVKERKKTLPAGRATHVELLGRAVPAVRTPQGVRATTHGRPAEPDAVRDYLEGKFGDALEDATEAMRALAKGVPPRRLAEEAYDLYVAFRPEIPPGKQGWGARGVLDLERVRRLRPPRGGSAR